MEIKTQNKVELKIEVEGREYALLLPIGSELEEAAKATSYFAGAVNKAYNDYLEKKKEEEEEPESEKEES